MPDAGCARSGLPRWPGPRRRGRAAGVAYAGQETRPIKALSEDEVREYLPGSGWVCEGRRAQSVSRPRHVLELADRLALSADQRRQTKRILEAMRAEAVRLGEQVVARERQLDGLFAAGGISPAELDRLAVELGTLAGPAARDASAGASRPA